MAARGRRFEIVHESGRTGRRTHFRFGAFRLALLGALAASAAALLASGVLGLPSHFWSKLQTKEVQVLIARRVQQGERLRALATRFEQLEYQAEELEERVQRVRRLYGLPELRSSSSSNRPSRPQVETIFSAALLHLARLESRVEEILSRSDSLLATLASWERDHAEEATTVPARLPLRGLDAVPTVLFGPKVDRAVGAVEFHAGLDLAAPAGSTVFAPAAGVVRWAGEAPASAGSIWWRLGRTVVVAHGGRYRTLFGHCDRLLVRTGQKVESGQPLATVGDSGHAASPRLHYEVRRRDADGAWLAVDPVTLLLDLDRFERELGTRLPSHGELDATAAPPLPPSYSR
jgi:murein DD-endopeptidase MepM/ murein hydrolase activator NlpD